MPMRVKTAAVYEFTCDVCGEEVAEDDTALPPDEWLPLLGGEQQAYVGPVCAKRGVIVQEHQGNWQIVGLA